VHLYRSQDVAKILGIRTKGALAYCSRRSCPASMKYSGSCEIGYPPTFTPDHFVGADHTSDLAR
jgi:hypothetical protein